MTPEEYDVLDITESEQILTSEELDDAEPETVADEVPAEPVAEPEAVSDPDDPEDILNDTAPTEDQPSEAEPEDELVGILTGLRDSLASLTARLDGLETRIAETEAREAARGKKLTGFFAPVPDGGSSDSNADPLPKIERKYIY